ncbi:glycoside hydrolase family 2 TIM barrel-domain containing protein [Arcicella rosea]|uniref:Glycoside hydrolase family 2 catalytic domain-containing protein n=1 Tax=Arcicella rosea TaxID=502909 RepID=A0A841EM77_9BACT|nr:glycoside hydrolase family 2 TIM barrel-domain containing protein [Arcicella rosea]MBB6004305.1 hypothetical protein [Arcicella rosea]
MQYSFKTKFLRILVLFLLFSIVGCNEKKTNNWNRRVFIDYKNGKYTLKKDGKPFCIKGAAGYTNLRALKNAGGNTIRTWDTTNLATILNEAKVYNLAVIVGLYMPYNEQMDVFYNNPKQIEVQFKSYESLVHKYKNHPSLLFWCLGNELSFPHKPKYNSFYRTFNNLVDMIHRVDPDHLVTTTMENFQRKKIFNIKFRTNIDFISFNIFGKLKELEKDLEDFEWFWDEPFLITEWGIDGPWTPTEHTVWGAYIENTSTKKAEQYLSIYKKYMPVKNPRFLGSMVFYWGQKQEYTPTWFSLFAENGAASEAVGTMQYIWKSQKPTLKAPQIKFMLVDKKGAKDNILFTPNKLVSAEVLMNTQESENNGLSFFWEILPEDWYKENDTYGKKRPKGIKGLFVEQKTTNVVFKTPLKEGPYRIYVTVYDQHGQFASCNTPFYVIEK